ncbi:MAG: endo-1,4-beta-xylanase [Gemmatimonadetes bacterium]|nr:endo-1,4-beta-xylanase [Gemmatimonadota bacterium]
MPTLVRRFRPRLARTRRSTLVAMLLPTLLPALLPALLLVACGGGDAAAPPSGPPPVTAVSVTPASVQLVPGGTATLSASVAPSGASTQLSWSSDAASIVTVAGSGTSATVTGVAPGTATVRVTSAASPSVSGTVTVTVALPPVATLTLSAATADLVPNQPLALTATARDASGGVITGAPVSWTSSQLSVATVAADGRVTAVAPGTALVTATAGTVTASATITVSDGAYVTTSGGTFTVLDGEARLTFPAGAFATPAAVTVRRTATAPAAPRLLPGTAVIVAASQPLATAGTLSLRMPATLAPDVVETNLRLARLQGSSWVESAPSVSRTTRLVSGALPSVGTFAVFAPPPSLRGYAQVAGIEVGTAVSVPALIADSAYRRVLRSEFNSITHENALKFAEVHPTATGYTFASADSTLAFSEANGMRAHGHVLLWHNQQPAWLTSGSPTRAFLMNALREHITTVVTRYAGRLPTWDVANEVLPDDGTALRPTFWVTIGGADIIDSAFVWARRADPTAKLYLNDYAVEGLGRKSDSLFALATRLKARGVPIDGIGLQGHFLVNGPSQQSLDANLARFANAGFDVRITELDVRLPDGTDNLAAQADMYGRAVSACLRQPRCKAVTVWGFTDRHSWIPGSFPGFGRGNLFDENYVPKPAYTRFSDLLRAASGLVRAPLP